MRHRRDLFPPDRALQARMAAALFGGGARGRSCRVRGVARRGGDVAPDSGRGAVRGGRPRGRGRDAQARNACARAAGRVARRAPCARTVRASGRAGRHAGPRLVCEAEHAALSWTTAVPWRPATIHVTGGLLRGCSGRELESVLARELTHVANRDAWVMTAPRQNGTRTTLIRTIPRLAAQRGP